MSRCLQLAQNCLTYDFIGTTCDESADDICTVQIPTGWRPAFLEQSTLTLFFDLYHSLPPSLSSLVRITFKKLYTMPNNFINFIYHCLGSIMLGATSFSSTFLI